jgi:hypothetical protein
MEKKPRFCKINICSVDKLPNFAPLRENSGRVYLTGVVKNYGENLKNKKNILIILLCVVKVSLPLQPIRKMDFELCRKE